jgi:hypothetical protein
MQEKRDVRMAVGEESMGLQCSALRCMFLGKWKRTIGLMAVVMEAEAAVAGFSHSPPLCIWVSFIVSILPV